MISSLVSQKRNAMNQEPSPHFSYAEVGVLCAFEITILGKSYMLARKL
jgi:hypothetical protein